MAVKLEIEFDLFLHKSEMNRINAKLQGVYVLCNDKKEPLYVGQTQYLKTRIQGHLTGHTNANEFHQEIEYIKMIFENDLLKRKLVESYLIAMTPGVKNAEKKYGAKIAIKKRNFSKINLFGTCNAPTCKLTAQSNGYCHMHGGNGISKEFIRNKAIEDFLAGKYIPKID